MSTQITIKRLPNDSLCLRISIGGNSNIGGYYCMYRGTREETINALEKILLVLQHMPELSIEEDSPIVGDS
jgi:hypothetical protein